MIMGTRSSRTARLNEAAPAITLTQADGSPWTLADAHATGPVVLVFLRGFF
jgi:peroxiredoxin